MKYIYHRNIKVDIWLKSTSGPKQTDENTVFYRKEIYSKKLIVERKKMFTYRCVIYSRIK